MHIELLLTWQMWDYVGTIFDGSLHGCFDPLMMVMLLRAIGPPSLATKVG